MSLSVSVVCSISASCCLNSIVTASKYFATSPAATQRASIDAAAALTSSGNSRDTKRTLPVSIYLDCSIGNTFSAKAAQCGQVSDEYSTIVTGASAAPSTISGSDPGLATSAATALSFGAATAAPQGIAKRL